MTSEGGSAGIRPARATDVPDILDLIRALADYERAPDQVVATEDDLRRALFPGTGEPTAFAHIAEIPTNRHDRPEVQVAGFALWFRTFSTWTGQPGIWLEDLFVLPAHRGLGLGRALLAALAAECRTRGYPRLDWSVLNWNTPSIDFYLALGARPLADWTQYRLMSEDLARLADQA